MAEPVTCTSHGQEISMAGDATLRHPDGSYCRSQEFTLASLTREQAMALLLIDRGEQFLRQMTGGSTGA